MVKSIVVGKFNSSKSGNDYQCLVFDLGYRTIKVFADKESLSAICDCKSEDLYNMKVGETLPVKIGG